MRPLGKSGLDVAAHPRGYRQNVGCTSAEEHVLRGVTVEPVCTKPVAAATIQS